MFEIYFNLITNLMSYIILFILCVHYCSVFVLT